MHPKTIYKLIKSLVKTRLLPPLGVTTAFCELPPGQVSPQPLEVWHSCYRDSHPQQDRFSVVSASCQHKLLCKSLKWAHLIAARYHAQSELQGKLESEYLAFLASVLGGGLFVKVGRIPLTQEEGPGTTAKNRDKCSLEKVYHSGLRRRQLHPVSSTPRMYRSSQRLEPQLF